MRHLIVAILTFILSLPATAQDLQKGLEAAERGDFAMALEEWRPLAEQGQVDAQNNLGILYDNGWGVGQNHGEAVKWYRLAAVQGHAMAQSHLGDMYGYGKGVPQDYIEAEKWYRLAAEQGIAVAQNNLGTMYNNGEGVAQDYAEAVRWYRKAAEQNYAIAQFNLANMYNNGKGVREDYAEALKWYRRAAEQGFANAQFILGNIYQGMGAIMADENATDEEITIATAFGPHDYAGLGVPPDHIEAAKSYRKAAEQGLVIAQYHICVLYQLGLGVPPDYVQAHMWCSLMKRSGLPEQKELATETLAMFVEQMTPEQIAKAQRLASEWMKKHGKAE